MYIQNRRDSGNFNGCSPLQHRSGLMSLKPAIAYFAYTFSLGDTITKPNKQLKNIKNCIFDA